MSELPWWVEAPPIPYGRALEDPHRPPADAPLWSENYAWVAYDPATAVGVLLHLGRMPFQPDLWRATTVVYLPDGGLVVNKTVAPCPDGVLGTGNLRFRCEAPLDRWQLSFHGTGRPTSTGELSQHRLVDGALVALTIDLSFDALTPIWDVGAMGSLGETHYEQHGRFHGTVSVDAATYRFNAAGYRDHSTGQRDFSGLGGHVWTHAIFPSGRAFTAFCAATPDGRVVLDDGVIITDGQLIRAAPVELPTLEGPHGAAGSVTIRFADEAPIVGEVVHALPFTLAVPNDMYFGFDPAIDHQLMLDSPVRFVWDGEVTHGWLERSATFAQLRPDVLSLVGPAGKVVR